MDPRTFERKQVPVARQANRVRCVAFGADCVKVEHGYQFIDIGRGVTAVFG